MMFAKICNKRSISQNIHEQVKNIIGFILNQIWSRD